VINGEAEVSTVVAFVSGLNNVHDPWGGLVTWYQDMMVTRARYRTFAAAMEQFSTAAEPPPRRDQNDRWPTSPRASRRPSSK
jgi:hypothetical protein